MINVPSYWSELELNKRPKNHGVGPSSTGEPGIESISRPVGKSLIATMLIGVLVWVWTDHIGDFKEVRRAAEDNGKTLAGISAKLDALEKLNSGVYRSQARAVGFEEKGLRVIPAKLNANVPYDAPLPTAGPDVFVRISQLQYSPNTQTLTYTLDAKLPNGGVVKNSRASTGVRLGETINILQPFGFSTPQVFLRLLAVPTPDQAIIAMGSKREEADK